MTEERKRVTRGSSRGTHFIVCSVGLVLSFSSEWLLNYAAFPAFDLVYFWTREASAVMGGLALSAVAVFSFWHPDAFTSRRILGGMLFALGFGATALAAGFASGVPTALVCGAGLLTIGSKLSNIIVGIACVGLGTRRLGASIALAYTVAYGLRGLLAEMPGAVNLALFCIVPLLAVLLAMRYAQAVLDQLHEEGSPAQMAIAEPASVLPFGHRLFLTLVVFRFIYGFTLTFGEIDRMPVVMLVALVPLVCVLAYVVLSRDRFSPDALFQVSLLCSVAAFLLLPLGQRAGSAVGVLLACGTGCFEIFMYFMLIALGARNTANALPLLAWGCAMASWGTLVGANVGRLMNDVAADPVASTLVAGSIVFGIVFYLVVVQRAFDFSSLIQRISSPEHMQVVADGTALASSLRERCEALGRARGLTSREQEIFEYLARGRNVRFVQEKLTVSYNTVKTHVSHIYAKLDVHSQQELINLVEEGRAGR